MELDFIPDTIICFCYEKDIHLIYGIYGNNLLYDCLQDYIKEIIKDYKSCMLYIQKSTLKYKIQEIKWV